MSARADDVVPKPRPNSRGTALTYAAGLLLATTVFVAHAWWIRDEQPTPAKQQMCAWAIFAATVVFAVVAFRVRRWIALPVAALGAASLATAYAYDALWPVRTFYPGQAAENVRIARDRLAELDRQSRDVALWRSGRLPERSIPFSVSGATLRFVPGLPTGVPVNGSSYDLASFEGPAGTNRTGWDRYGEELASVLPQKRARAEADLAAFQSSFAKPPMPAADVARRWIVDSVALTAVLLAFNALALAFSGLVCRDGGRVAAKATPSA